MNKSLSFLEWLSLIGSVASIVGVVLSIYVIYNLRQIRRSYIFAARAPDLVKALRKHSSRINDLLKDFKTSFKEIEAELAKCSPVLESLRNKIGRQERKSISEVVQLISENKILSVGSKNAVWDIYKELLKVEEAMRNLHKDKQWER